MNLNLQQRRVLVTGATRGIGRAIAETLAQEGAAVAVCARSEAGVRETVESLRRHGVEVHGEAVDARDAQAMAAFVARSVERLGGLDHVVSNVSTRPEAAEGEARWREGFEADLLQHVRLTELCLPHLLAASSPSLVYLSSLAANSKQLLPEEVAYGAFKAALVNYAGHLSERYGRKGLRANCVSPSPIYFEGGAWDTYERERPKLFEFVKAQTVFQRFGTPQEVANAAVFLLSPAASFITGVNLRVDGGMGKSVNF